MTDKTEIKNILRWLMQTVSDIEGCSIVSTSGLTIASELMAEAESATFSALSADLTKSGEIVASELKIGNVNEIIVNSTKGNIITMVLGKKAFLVCLVRKKSNIGLVLLHMNRVAHRLLRYIN